MDKFDNSLNISKKLQGSYTELPSQIMNLTSVNSFKADIDHRMSIIYNLKFEHLYLIQEFQCSLNSFN